MDDPTDLTKRLQQLREGDPDIALVLHTFEEIERIYREALEAMGLTSKQTAEVKNSARVTISFPSQESSF